MHSTYSCDRNLAAESDARYGSFDFGAAHAEAPPDLADVLANNESLPFRRRGYERDAMLRCDQSD